MSDGRRWGVVGGGVLGMTLALRLAQAGERVTLLEAAGHLGGLADAWQVGDVVWDRHYHVTLGSDTATRALLDELGLDTEVAWVETGTGMYAGGRLAPASGPIDFLRLPSLNLLDKARLALTILYASRVRDWHRLEQVPVADWLTRWSGRRTFRRFWLPLLRAKVGDAHTDTSAAFIWATVQRLYAARRNGMKRERFGYVPGGYARTLERLGARLHEAGVEVHLGQPVASVARQGPGFQVATVPGDQHVFDQVVVTTAAPLAARMCTELTADERSRLLGVRYQGIVCASLVLRRPLGPYYLTYITDEAPFTAVVEMSAFVDPSAFGGRALVYLPRYVAPDDALFDEPDDEVQERFVAGLERMYPHFRRADVEACRISRVRHVFAVPTVGYSSRVPPSTTEAGVHLVGSAHLVNATLNVDETVRLAENAARRLLDGGTTAGSAADAPAVARKIPA